MNCIHCDGNLTRDENARTVVWCHVDSGYQSCWAGDRDTPMATPGICRFCLAEIIHVSDGWIHRNMIFVCEDQHGNHNGNLVATPNETPRRRLEPPAQSVTLWGGVNLPLLSTLNSRRRQQEAEIASRTRNIQNQIRLQQAQEQQTRRAAAVRADIQNRFYEDNPFRSFPQAPVTGPPQLELPRNIMFLLEAISRYSVDCPAVEEECMIWVNNFEAAWGKDVVFQYVRLREAYMTVPEPEKTRRIRSRPLTKEKE